MKRMKSRCTKTNERMKESATDEKTKKDKEKRENEIKWFAFSVLKEKG